MNNNSTTKARLLHVRLTAILAKVLVWLHCSRLIECERAHRGGIRLMARSASAVMVRLGLTPTLADIAAPSTTYSPG